MQVVFRVDASVQIGTGHVMRCLAFAQGLTEQGAECQFVCREHEGHLQTFIEQQGFACRLLPAVTASFHVYPEDVAHATWLGVDWHSDAQQTLAYLPTQFDWLVVDHYAIDYRWQAIIKAECQCKLWVIDDLADRSHLADVLLDQNVTENMYTRYDLRLPASATRLIGPNYALLRSEFAEFRQQSLYHVRELHHILVFLGGADADNMTERILLKVAPLATHHGWRVTVIVGISNQHQASLTVLCAAFQMTLLVGVSNMAQVLSSVDVVIGAGGINTWERACLGVPTLALSLADNQYQGLLSLAKEGALWFMRNIEIVPFALTLLHQQPELLAQLQEKTAGLTDGLGVDRVIRVMMPAFLDLKPVRMSDAELMLRWRNHPSVRHYSRQSSEISLTDHEQWLSQSLARDDRVMWLAHHQNQPMGVIRYDRIEDDHAAVEVSLYLAPEAQGKGLGKALLLAGEIKLKHVWSDICVINAEVLSDNEASLALFEQAGYEALPYRFRKQVGL